MPDPPRVVFAPRSRRHRVPLAGREVTIEIRDGEQRHTCTTPCTLPLAPGAYSARVDGLDRTVIAGDAEVVIAPTRYGRLGIAVALITLGAAGLSFAGHWSSPLDDRERLAAGLGGAAFMGFAIPVLTSGSAKIGAPIASHVDVFAGAHGSMGAIGVGYRPHDAGFGAQLRTRAASPERFELAIGPTWHAPRLAFVQAAVALHVGFSSERGPETPPDLASEMPAIAGELGLHALFEIEGRVEIALPGRLRPSIGASYDGATAVDAGVHVAF